MIEPGHERYQILLSAPDEREANRLVDALVSSRLVAGAMITKGVCRYWWNGALTEREYYNISAFTKGALSAAIEAEVARLHSDDVPILIFSRIDFANRDFLEWIDANTG